MNYYNKNIACTSLDDCCILVSVDFGRKLRPRVRAMVSRGKGIP